MQSPVTFTAIAAAWGVLLAGATGVMKATDAIRSWTEQHLKFTLPSYTWIVVPFAVGVTTTLTSHLNPIVTLYPGLAHVYGEVLSGIALGAIASPLHHGTAWLSAKSKAVGGGIALPLIGEPPADDGQAVLDHAFGPDDTPSVGVDGPADGPTDPAAAPEGAGGGPA